MGTWWMCSWRLRGRGPRRTRAKGWPYGCRGHGGHASTLTHRRSRRSMRRTAACEFSYGNPCSHADARRARRHHAESCDGGTMRIGKTLKPGRRGTARWVKRFGDRLIARRYRYDPDRQTRYTTGELGVDAWTWRRGSRLALRTDEYDLTPES